jgi:UDP-N-acetyl-D-mannosaminuronate dehydrogenase
VDDLRESPAVALARHLTAAGAAVYAYEPYRSDAALEGINQVTSLETALISADMIVLAVGHNQFTDLDPLTIKSMTRARIVFDAVRAWDKAAWELAGFMFYGLARKY